MDRKMIEPSERDIGRKVVYTGNRYPGGKLEEGVITSFNPHTVFVRYGADTGSKGTSRVDLEWLRPYRPSDVRPTIRCPRCAGHGIVPVMPAASLSTRAPDDGDCSLCKGKGRIPAETTERT